MTLLEACRLGREQLGSAGVPEAELSAWYLLEFVTGCTRSSYFGHPERELTDEQEKRYIALLEKRAARIPLQQLTGEQEFMGLSFQVNEHVLVPRQDTELLVEEALKVLKPGMRFLDLCTGSGCILLSLLHYGKGVSGVGTDISEEALKVADRNRERLALEAELIRGDLFSQVKGSYDLIVSNPPYIRTGEIPKLMEEVRLHEPLLALDGHEDGLYFYRKIAEESRAFLKPGGGLCLEIGCDQGEDVQELLKNAGFYEIEVKKDLAGLDRVVCGTWVGGACNSQLEEKDV